MHPRLLVIIALIYWAHALPVGRKSYAATQKNQLESRAALLYRRNTPSAPDAAPATTTSGDQTPAAATSSATDAATTKAGATKTESPKIFSGCSNGKVLRVGEVCVGKTFSISISFPGVPPSESGVKLELMSQAKSGNGKPAMTCDMMNGRMHGSVLFAVVEFNCSVPDTGVDNQQIAYIRIRHESDKSGKINHQKITDVTLTEEGAEAKPIGTRGEYFTGPSSNDHPDFVILHVACPSGASVSAGDICVGHELEIAFKVIPRFPAGVMSDKITNSSFSIDLKPAKDISSGSVTANCTVASMEPVIKSNEPMAMLKCAAKIEGAYQLAALHGNVVYQEAMEWRLGSIRVKLTGSDIWHMIDQSQDYVPVYSVGDHTLSFLI